MYMYVPLQYAYLTYKVNYVIRFAPSSPTRAQELFLHSVLTLTSIHISLVAPLGPSCVRMACGRQVKPLRNLLFKFIDSQLPTALDKVQFKHVLHVV